MKENDVELYCCFSLNLRNFLYEHGLKYKIAALHPNTNNLFWIYIKNDKLKELLNKWTNHMN